jgi:transcriptional regulator with XRE-family HTH domain/lipopolysaccharide biosynthesis regulator YciM
MPRQKSTHIDDPRSVGERLREARRRAGLSQRELAFHGCTPAYISRIEAGDRIPSLQLLRELGRQLGVSADFLATGSDESERTERDKLVQAEVALRLDDTANAAELFGAVLHGSDDERLRADASAGLGQVAFRDGDPNAAIGHFEHALALYGDEPSSHPALADSLGRAYAIAGETDRAIALFERCLAAAESAGDTVERLRFSVLLANALVDAEQLPRAEELLAAVLDRSAELDDPLSRARVYWSQSRLHSARGNTETAERHARNALAILEVTEHDHQTARAHQLLAHIQLDRDRPEEALALLRKGLELLGDNGNDYERAKFGLEEARALARCGRAEDAARLALDAASKLESANPGEAGRAYAVAAEALEARGDDSGARELLERSAELHSVEPGRELAQVLARLADLYDRAGDPRAAYATLKRAVQAQGPASRSGS